MSRECVSLSSGIYKKPGCVTENMFSVWIWLREKMDVELTNHTTAMVAENNLVNVRDAIEKNMEKIMGEQEVLKSEMRAKARACKGKGETKEQTQIMLRRLLPFLKRIKSYGQQIALATQQLSLLNVQITAFDKGRFQKQMSDTLRESVVAMRKIGVNEDLSTIVDDMEDNIQQQNEVSDSMSLSLVNSMDDGDSDDALMRELMALTGDDEEVVNTEPKPLVEPLASVASPTTVVLPPVLVSVTQEVVPEVDQERQQEQEKHRLHSILAPNLAVA